MLNLENIKYKKNFKNWLFLSFFIIFWFFQQKNSLICLFFLIPIFLFFHLYKVNGQIAVFIFCTSYLWIFLLKTLNLENVFSFFLKNLNLQNYIFKHIDNIHSKNVAEFIKLFIFNKYSSNNKFFSSIKELGIGYLIILSGIHLLWIQKLMFLITNTLFKNNPSIKKYANIACNLFIFFYWWSTNFANSIFRPFLNLLIYEENALIKWSKNLIFFSILKFNMLDSYSFILSYGISLIFLISNQRNKDKKFFNYFWAWSFSTLLLLPFNKKIYIFAIFNQIIFSPIIAFLFFYFLIFFWCSIFTFLNEKFLNYFLEIVNFFSLNKYHISFISFNTAIFISLIVVFLLFFLYFNRPTTLIKRHNNFYKI